MEYLLTDFQKEMQKFAADWAKKELAPVVTECDRKGEFPMEVFKKYYDAGFTTMGLPEKFGGQGLSALDMVLINEEIAKIDAGFMVSAGCSELAFLPIMNGGTDEQIQFYLDIVLNGGIASFGLTEPDAGSDAAACRTTAVRDGDDYILNGRKCFITSAGLADVFTIFATVDKTKGVKGLTCFMVERDRPGVSIGKEEDKMGLRLSNTADVVLEDVRVPASHRVGPEGKGFNLAMMTLDHTRGTGSAGALGIAQRALDESVAYAKTRKTFGKPIIANQGISFMLADMEIQIQAARALLWHCARMIDCGVTDTKLGSCTKVFVSDTTMKVTTDAVQVLGGYGYSREYPVEKLMRDAKIWQIFEGTNQIQRMVIGGTLAR